jgi:hypothetical protein
MYDMSFCVLSVLSFYGTKESDPGSVRTGPLAVPTFYLSLPHIFVPLTDRRNSEQGLSADYSLLS